MTLQITLLGLLVGCGSLPAHPLPPLQEARLKFESGELYEAKKMAEAFLKNHPNDFQAQKLMAEIIDQEIARHKEIFATSAIEELTPQAKSDEVQTWLERGRYLLELKQYDEAVLAVEKVFLYDPENLRASQLIDEIKQQALKEGRHESLIQSQVFESEVEGRVQTYRNQARQWIREGRWGAAKLAVEKVLLLAPEDHEALKLYDQIRNHQSQAEHETRKAL